MTPEKKIQEDLCLQTRYVIDKLRTNLFMINDFERFDDWDKKLKRLKSDINNIYWNI